ncbi:hypothetical protein N7533_002095 [Penicillium manginii]|uniref:uncharacterized protein n=1 Tax=Penicillium manginii TaxID=203109 RepID=UPI002546A8DB|nr:uncharacterized protein N7533_002095 [Penicillium manginii]KAJ5763414.1 hypothetical protein N7533_002095 [Penicillium manginii]
MSAIKSFVLALAAAASAASLDSKSHAGSDVLTVGVLGDYGWTGWEPASLNFCNNVMPRLITNNITIPRELQNDCDPGDRGNIVNATAEQTATASYIGKVCAMKNCSAIVSVGDNFYSSAIDFSTGGVNRFEKAWSTMYEGGIFNNTRWYQTLGNHDIVKGQAGVDFQTKIAPLYDSRWYFGTEGLPYYTYDLAGKDWKATFAVVDSDCFINKYQKDTSVYQNEYTLSCYKDKQVQIDFVEQAFAKSDAQWKFLQIHHGYMSSSTNYTELAPFVEIVEKYKGIVVNGHDHCLAHYYSNNTNFILTGGSGYAEPGDCNYGVALGPYAKFLGANSQGAGNGFVTMDISKKSVNVEYYARDMSYEGSDLYPVKNSMKPIYSFAVDAKK